MKVRDAPPNSRILTKFGRPWLIVEEDNDLFVWEGIHGEVKWEIQLPFGLLLHFPPNTPLNEIPQQQLRRLAVKYSLLIIRGIQPLSNQNEFEEKTTQYGNTQSWFFGNVLTVKLNPSVDINNVLSSEAMPMHFDGLFKLNENGKPCAPAFQYFYCKYSAGTTLFSNTALFSQIYPALLDKQWRVFTPKNDSFGGLPIVLDLFEKHPVTQQTIFRFHEPWGQEKTVFKPTHVEVVSDDGDKWAQRLTDCLYNRQFCLHHHWCDNDVVIADNFTLMHTRLAFENSLRELWRIHYN
jgi:alpha-ketoglutarate-dependent taurine dioxygenase